jgi:hypothetical protein
MHQSIVGDGHEVSLFCRATENPLSLILHKTRLATTINYCIPGELRSTRQGRDEESRFLHLWIPTRNNLLSLSAVRI